MEYLKGQQQALKILGLEKIAIWGGLARLGLKALPSLGNIGSKLLGLGKGAMGGSLGSVYKGGANLARGFAFMGPRSGIPTRMHGMGKGLGTYSAIKSFTPSKY